MVICILIINLLTNLSNIYIKYKFIMGKLKDIGITSYYQNLPRGEKDRFAREVAEAIDQSSANVRRKIRLDRWSSLERPVIENIINERERR